MKSFGRIRILSLVSPILLMILCNMLTRAQDDVCAGETGMDKKVCEMGLKSAKRQTEKEALASKRSEICEKCQDCAELNSISSDCIEECKQMVKSVTNEDDGSTTTISRCMEAAPTELPHKPCVAGMATNPPRFCTGGIYDCMDLVCLGHYLKRPYTNIGKALRKEYRMLSDQERKAFNDAVLEMKLNGAFDRLAAIHAKISDGQQGAHGGAAFLPWHREFIKRYEFELRQINPNLALPYWDTTLEARLTNPRDSILFSSELIGSLDQDEYVADGPFARWRVFNWMDESTQSTFDALLLKEKVERSRSKDDKVYLQTSKLLNGDPTQRINRTLEPAGKPVDDTLINSILAETKVEFILAPHTNPSGKNAGGQMAELTMAANDPIFYMMHSFADMIWELWRTKHQTRNQRESVYPSDVYNCSNPEHKATNTMLDNFQNIDGLSNRYTDNLYSYQDRPTCSRAKPNCGSKFLFCDFSHGEKCASKLKVGSSCVGYNFNEDVCYKGACTGGICVKSKEQTATERAVTTTTIRPTTKSVTSPSDDFKRPKRPPLASSSLDSFSMSCYNSHFCCDDWAARGECELFAGFMGKECRAACHFCISQQSSAASTKQCVDRSAVCASYKRAGACGVSSLSNWMSENCRKSCELCSSVQRQNFYCSGCRDHHWECPLWSRQGFCEDSTQREFMFSHCCVSCSY